MDISHDPIGHALGLQASACAALGSDFSAALLTLAARSSLEPGPVRDLFAPWPHASARRHVEEATPLRLLGALHERVLAGTAPEVAAAYPAGGRPGDPQAAWAAAERLIAAEPAGFADFMAHEPQTNETRRSICLLGGFLTAAGETGLPLRLFELGASAGLNQNWDHFRFDLGAAGAWGDPASRVHMDTEWRGGRPPLEAPVSVASRAACDRKPVDITEPAARRRLKAYIWPDQAERLARLDAAIALALAARTMVEAADAADWTAARVAPQPGFLTVLFHSVFWQYMPLETQGRLAATIQQLGARATAEAAFAWLRLEPPPAMMSNMEIRLTLWPGGEDRLLGRSHPHGAWVEWLT
jgi:hypothetical protein